MVSMAHNRRTYSNWTNEVDRAQQLEGEGEGQRPAIINAHTLYSSEHTRSCGRRGWSIDDTAPFGFVFL